MIDSWTATHGGSRVDASDDPSARAHDRGRDRVRGVRPTERPVRQIRPGLPFSPKLGERWGLDRPAAPVVSEYACVTGDTASNVGVTRVLEAPVSADVRRARYHASEKARPGRNASSKCRSCRSAAFVTRCPLGAPDTASIADPGHVLEAPILALLGDR